MTTHPKIRVDDQGHHFWTGYHIPSRVRTTLRIATEAESNKPRGPTARLARDDGDYPLHYITTASAEPRMKFAGKSQHPRRPMVAMCLDIPIDELPPIMRTCTQPACINPYHYALVIVDEEDPDAEPRIIPVGSIDVSPPSSES